MSANYDGRAVRGGRGSGFVWVVAIMLAGLLGWLGVRPLRGASARADDLTLPQGAMTERFDFERPGLEGWRSVDGQ